MKVIKVKLVNILRSFESSCLCCFTLYSLYLLSFSFTVSVFMAAATQATISSIKHVHYYRKDRELIVIICFNELLISHSCVLPLAGVAGAHSVIGLCGCVSRLRLSLQQNSVVDRSNQRNSYFRHWTGITREVLTL